MGNYSPELKRLIRIAEKKHDNQNSPETDRKTLPMQTPEQKQSHEILQQSQDARTITLLLKYPKITAQLEKIIRHELHKMQNRR